MSPGDGPDPSANFAPAGTYVLVEMVQSLRGIARDKAFSATVVLSLALGIGANTAIFSLINGVLLRPLAYREPLRLVSVNESIPRFANLYPRLPVNFGRYYEWRSRARSFVALGLYDMQQEPLTGSGEPELIGGARTSANLLEVLGVRPSLGRDFRVDEERAGREKVVLLSDSLWKRKFAGDPQVLGRKLLLNGEPYEVIGVLPPGFELPRPHFLRGTQSASLHLSFLRPFGYTEEQLKNTDGEFNHSVIGRLRTGVTPESALAELNVIEADIDRTAKEKLDVHALVQSLHEEVTGESRQGLILLMAAVASVLLLLCANLANLSLARGASRAREFAIRTALGAGRGDLVRRTLLESILLSCAGGLLGVALAYAGVAALVRLAPRDLPRVAEVGVDWQVLLFAAVVSVFCGVLFGILPALRASGADPQQTLRAGSHTITEGRRSLQVRNLLVGVETALSVVLLVVAGLLISSFARLMSVDRGFDVERVLTAKVTLPATRYKEDLRKTAFFDRLLESARHLPGVESVGLVSHLPLQGETWIDIIGTEHDSRPELERPTINVRFVSPDYFKTLGIAMQDGRSFEEGDRKRKAVILSHKAAETLWPGTSAVGRRALHGDDEILEVVGVTPDFRSTALDADPVRIMYIPYWQRPQTEASILVRTRMNPIGIASSLRNRVWQIDSDVPVPEIRTLVEVMNESVGQRRYQLLLIGLFALAGLALASIGIYGVVAYGVTRRRGELGIRMALGAAAPDVRRMVVSQGMLPVLLGAAAGLLVSLAAGRLVRTMLFEVSPADPFTIVSVIAVLAAVSLAACLIPAARATRINPIEALRCE